MKMEEKDLIKTEEKRLLKSFVRMITSLFTKSYERAKFSHDFFN